MSPPAHVAFQADRLLAAGPLPEIVAAVKQRFPADDQPPVLIFDDATGNPVDVDFRGSLDDVVARIPEPEATTEASDAAAPAPRAGRPKLGVVAREVTLLPRHWEWLAAQPGGASVALRKLVDAARRANEEGEAKRRRRDAAYRFMAAMAGDRPGFEEASRALFADDLPRFDALVAPWPADIRDHVRRLASHPA